MIRALLYIALVAPSAKAQTVFDGELWAPGKAGVGTASPGARFEAQGAAGTGVVLQASGVDLTPAFRVGADGTLGFSTASASRVTVSGVGDVGDLALELRGGDLWPNTSNYQVTFGYDGGTQYRQAIRSRHAATVSSNSVTFLMWTLPDLPGSIGSREVLSLVTHSTGALVHILPPPSGGTTTVQLAVSDGLTLGGGTMRRKSEGTASSIALKEDIRSLGPEAETAAFEEVAALRHVMFRYKGKKGKKQRGLLYEEAPASVRAGGGVSMDARLLNTEMAAREFMRRLAETEIETKALGGGR